MNNILSFTPVSIVGTHDPSACVFKNGNLTAAVEEERLCRNKHAPYRFPRSSIRFCLQEANLNFNELGEITIPFSPKLFLRRQNLNDLDELEHANQLSDRFVSALKSISQNSDYSNQKEDFEKKIVERLREEFGNKEFPPLKFISHHLAHAASAHYPAPFSQSTLITMDGAGEYDSTVIWKARGDDIERIKTFSLENSLGYFFSTITEFLGFDHNNGEGKVMALAPYGQPDQNLQQRFNNIFKLTDDAYDVRVISLLYNKSLPLAMQYISDSLGIERRDSKSDPLSQEHKDLAWLAQNFLEKAVQRLVKFSISKTGISNVGLAGGVALNCKVNKNVREMDQTDNVFFQPVANDAGLSLGAGWYRSNQTNEPSRSNQTHVYLGPSYQNNEVKNVLKESKVPFRKSNNLIEEAAEFLASGNIIGWFQGKTEMGPRALGNRSILADPRTKKSKNRVNVEVKHRQKWRPFSPSILKEEASNYLKHASSSPFMIDTFEVKPEKTQDMEAVIHPKDATTRPQTVTADSNPYYYRLIKQFQTITDVPLLLNTSFNDHGEPIVNTPRQAIKDFFGMGLDYLCIHNYIISKNELQTPDNRQARREENLSSPEPTIPQSNRFTNN